MNLREKLKAMESAKKTAAPKPVFTDCQDKTNLRPPEGFPGAFDLRRDVVSLMVADAMPETLDPTRILYLDTETTGLMGGAGTVAFLVGLGTLREDGFAVRQLLMRDYPEEIFVLRKVAEAAENADVICTFNGKSFDIPLLKSRFLMHRMDPSVLDLPHIDLLHMARRVWKLRLQQCNLTRLEEAILGHYRENDLPGALVPQRYFDYLKLKDMTLLDDILEHNDQDIASLCILLNRMAELYAQPETVNESADLLSMGMGLERMHHPEEARRCYRLIRGGRYHAAAQKQLSASLKHSGAMEEAIAVWQDMIARAEGGIEPMIELAKYYEHTADDLDAAMAMTRKALETLAEPGLSEALQETRFAVQYRYARLKRKQTRKASECLRRKGE